MGGDTSEFESGPYPNESATLSNGRDVPAQSLRLGRRQYLVILVWTLLVSCGFTAWTLWRVVQNNKWNGSAADFIGCLVLLTVFWVLSGLPFLIFFGKGGRDAEQVAETFGIVATRGRKVLGCSLKERVDRPTSRVWEECQQLINDRFSISKKTVDANGHVLTASCGPIASFYFPFQLRLTVTPDGENSCVVDASTTTSVTLGMPVVDMDGLTALALVAASMRGFSIPRGDMWTFTWKRVVDSANRLKQEGRQDSGNAGRR